MLMRQILAIYLICILVQGCSTTHLLNNSQHNTESTKAVLEANLWLLEDVDQAGVIDYVSATLRFDSDRGLLSGSTGCNRYSASYQFDGEKLSVGIPRSTRKSCVPALMNQERKFLAALSEASFFAIDQKQSLTLYDTNRVGRLRLIAKQVD